MLVGNRKLGAYGFCIFDKHLDKVSGGRGGKELMVKILSNEATRQKQIGWVRKETVRVPRSQDLTAERPLSAREYTRDRSRIYWRQAQVLGFIIKALSEKVGKLWRR